jgi:S1-C subfamily serine protease
VKYLLAVVLAVVTVVAVPSPLPHQAARKVTTGGEAYCSAVVISPGVALTAGHCLRRPMEVDGIKVTTVVAHANTTDVAVLRVPGLKCPCVALGVRPAKGDQVLAVGFPGDRDGERVISPVARVKFVGALRGSEFGFLGDMPDMDDPYIVTDAAIVTNGDSGGALLAMQGGEWKVVGITAIGIPEGPCLPFVGCGKEIASGFVPVDQAEKLL